MPLGECRLLGPVPPSNHGDVDAKAPQAWGTRITTRTPARTSKYQVEQDNHDERNAHQPHEDASHFVLLFAEKIIGVTE